VRTRMTNGSAKLLSRILCLASLFMVGAGLLFRPGFFATHFSRDGVLEPVTSFCIVAFDMSLAALGIFSGVLGVGLMRGPEVWRKRIGQVIQVPAPPDGQGRRSLFALSLRIRGMHFSLISLAVLAIVMALKVYWSVSVPHVPIEQDAKSYCALARNIAEGRGYVVGPEPWTQTPPAWPLTLAATYSVGKGSVNVSYLVQTLFGCGVVLMIYGMGRYFFGEATGVLAAVLLGTYPSMIWMEGTLLTEPMYIFLEVGFILLAVKATLDGRRLSAAFCGIAFGLTLLCRAVLLYFWPFLCASFLLAGSQRSLKSRFVQVLIATCSTVLVVLPWSLYLSHTCGRFVPISAPTYHALWSASRGFMWRGFSDDRVRSFLRGKKFASWIDMQDHLRQDAFNEIRRDPMPYLKLVVSGPRKLIRGPMWHSYMANYHPDCARPLTDYYAIIDKGVGLFLGAHRQVKSQAQALKRYLWLYERYFDGIIVLSVAGIVLSVRMWRALLIQYLLIAYTVLFQSAVGLPKARYLLPIMPFLFLFASVTVTRTAYYSYRYLAAKSSGKEAPVSDQTRPANETL